MQEVQCALPLLVFLLRHFSQPLPRHRERASFCVEIAVRMRHGKRIRPTLNREINKGGEETEMKKIVLMAAFAASVAYCPTCAATAAEKDADRIAPIPLWQICRIPEPPTEGAIYENEGSTPELVENTL